MKVMSVAMQAFQSDGSIARWEVWFENACAVAVELGARGMFVNFVIMF